MLIAGVPFYLFAKCCAAFEVSLQVTCYAEVACCVNAVGRQLHFEAEVALEFVVFRQRGCLV